jgi:hypothetical protein
VTGNVTAHHHARKPVEPVHNAMVEQLAALARRPGGVGGHDFATLLSLVAGESGFQAHAANHLTGAHGPFQFVKATWLSLLRTHGAALGLAPALIAQITENAKGRPSVADPAALHQLLALRDDLATAARVAAFYLDDNRASLQHALHRHPSEAELRLSFLLGAHGATKLIQAAAATPERSAAAILPHAAAANRHLFYTNGGAARGAAEMLAYLGRKFRTDAAKYAAYAKVQAADA